MIGFLHKFEPGQPPFLLVIPQKSFHLDFITEKDFIHNFLLNNSTKILITWKEKWFFKIADKLLLIFALVKFPVNINEIRPPNSHAFGVSLTQLWYVSRSHALDVRKTNVSHICFYRFFVFLKVIKLLCIPWKTYAHSISVLNWGFVYVSTVILTRKIPLLLNGFSNKLRKCTVMRGKFTFARLIVIIKGRKMYDTIAKDQFTKRDKNSVKN